MIRDRNVEAIKTMVAVNAVCACEGRSIPKPRAHRDGGGGVEGWIGSHPDTGVDSIRGCRRECLS
jgi:hypothetical protein